ncbi:flagellar basal body L-ring protein FlgH [Massilia antarctica]|uniref:flagellar basal body L-ring protein FlgH n=1 Tax=Massilia antarctica TaxID=2765360 RepID=UPI0006BD7CDD|nr:flagellar basal body L-ring protein FlgH [Massilia sp. H27-R4]MCY0915670.1 flagellar basal body L-ring protein FlgH [Massilia sp. H27-R4]CUI02862.1 Flagellar L-ring protein FlgH [Janthinobacterium sp. CG23_2]CUU26648.1 Flagellar L-ring protein FlgH [Janthinobacterium sp. CG23_2]
MNKQAMARFMGRFGQAVGLLCAAAMLGGTAQATSLYQEGSYKALASDQKARRRGDLVTIMVVENSSATSTANTTARRGASINADIELPHKARGVGIQTNNNMDGRGQTVREGKVLAQITVVVKDVTENGDLLVAGEQLLEVNNERQQIRVEGRIRTQDLSDTNVVLSTRIADAKISYVGAGDLSDKQRPGWWQQVLTWFGM